MDTLSPLVAVVDDDPALRDLVKHVLGTVGHDALSHGTVEDFLDDDHVDRAGCVICDVRMPGLGGLGLHGEDTTGGGDASSALQEGAPGQGGPVDVGVLTLGPGSIGISHVAVGWSLARDQEAAAPPPG